MSELTQIRLRTLAWFVFLPCSFLIVVPWWLHAHFEGPSEWHATRWEWLGLWLILNGAGLAGWCVNLFNVEGRGTPVPFDPPKRFVAGGPYRFVRNPMALGLFLVLTGETILYRSRAVLAYLLLVITVVALFVRFVEEPGLERRFGVGYREYKRQVPRWVPRVFSAAPRTKTR